MCLTELLPPFISQTLRDGTPQVNCKNWNTLTTSHEYRIGSTNLETSLDICVLSRDLLETGHKHSQLIRTKFWGQCPCILRCLNCASLTYFFVGLLFSFFFSFFLFFFNTVRLFSYGHFTFTTIASLRTNYFFNL